MSDMETDNANNAIKQLTLSMQQLVETVTAIGTNVETSKTELSAQISAVQQQLQTSFQELKQEFERKTEALSTEVSQLRQQVVTMQKQVDNLTEYTKVGRFCHLTVKVLDSKLGTSSAAGAEAHMAAYVKHQRYDGPLTDIEAYSFSTGQPKRPTDLPANTKVWAVSFKVTSRNAAYMLRQKANESIKQGHILSLSLFKTQPERKAEQDLRKSEAFKRAVAAAKGRNEKIQWGFGTCTVAGEVWTPTRVADAGTA